MSADPQGLDARLEPEKPIIDELRAQGYEHHFYAAEDGLACEDCDEVVDPRRVRIDAQHRYEGVSNPSDMSIVFAISNGPCGHKGVLVAAYGPTMEPEEAEVVRLLGQDPEPPAEQLADDPITAREAAEQVLMEEGESEAGAHLGDQMP